LGDVELIANICTTGIAVNSTLAGGSQRRQFFLSHPAPSKYKPYT